MELRELVQSGPEGGVYVVGALGATVGVVAAVQAGLDGGALRWASGGGVAGLAIGLLLVDYADDSNQP